ncbi:MAG: DUF378 domain-containing protein [Candidatus Paceibacterota bacterium]|jgi:uncharacterized membrane protein YuzA (DUF378 family)
MRILVIIGGINWGLVGLGMLINSNANWNIVHMILARVPVVEAIIYLLVGISAVILIFNCKCSKCVPENTSQGM